VYRVRPAEKAAVIAAAMKAAGTAAHGRVGIYAPNVPNWMVIIQACNRSSAYVGARMMHRPPAP
jgi:long-chain acyl-CoA synthetase